MSCRGEILVVDDDEFVRRTISRVFGPRLGPTRVAADGRQALEIVDAGSVPCLVITDLDMPHLRGEELISALRARGLGHIPVITMSGGPSPARPGSAHLQKPFGFADLSLAIKQCALHERCALRERRSPPTEDRAAWVRATPG